MMINYSLVYWGALSDPYYIINKIIYKFDDIFILKHFSYYTYYKDNIIQKNDLFSRSGK